MKRSQLRAELKTASRLALWFLLLASAAYFFSYPEVDPDLWGHLFFGREIIRSGQLPLHNLYSYTAPHHLWINHEWLAEVVFYGFFSSLGSPGLILLKARMGTALIPVPHRSLTRDIFFCSKRYHPYGGENGAHSGKLK